MENKRIISKKSLKRRSSILNEGILKYKRLSIVDYSSDNVSLCENLINPKTITSSSLTSNFKVSCILENKENINDTLLKQNSSISDLRNMLQLNECAQESENLLLNVQRDQYTPAKNILPNEQFQNFKNIDLNMSNLKMYGSTPEEQILSLEKFKKLPKPELNLSLDNDNTQNLIIQPSFIKSTVLTKSNSDVTEIMNNNERLNDSFEMIKLGLFKSQSVTPVSLCFNSTFLTPETPCDINNIDLEAQIKPLNSLANLNQGVRLKSRRRISNSISVSPMFYDKEQKSKKNMDSVNKSKIDKVICPYDEIEDKNKIEEISVDSIFKIIENDFTSDSYAFHIIDCRYPYEYEGGHIDSAVNLYTPWQLLNYVFLSNYDLESLRKPLDDPEESMENLIKDIQNIKKPNSNWKYQAFIFHCEFSSIRAPEMARCLRNMDRYANINCYPNLFFPKIYIMKKGYKEFYNKFKNLCKPCNYVKMDIKDQNKKSDQCREKTDDLLMENNGENVDEVTRQIQIKEYNTCKKESQEQMQLVSHFMKTN